MIQRIESTVSNDLSMDYESNTQTEEICSDNALLSVPDPVRTLHYENFPFD
jgi:hypothetical protein